MDILTIKAISLASVFIISLILGLLPMKFERSAHRSQRFKQTLSFLSCFGGGVFLGACLLDLLPDVQEAFSEVLRDLKIETKFPIVEFVVSVGFFIVFIIEHVVLAWKENSILNPPSRRTSTVQADRRAMTYNSIDAGPIPTTPLLEDHDHSMAFSVHEDPSSHSNLRSILLLLALSMHSVFEGLAIGLQTVTEHLFQLLAAIIIHKGIIAMSLGLKLAQSRLKIQMKVISVIIFSIASPVGIGIGMGISNNSQSAESELICAILQGFACGTFLYITFFEVLPHEMNKKKDRLMKLMFIILGFATICGVIYMDISQNGS